MPIVTAHRHQALDEKSSHLVDADPFEQEDKGSGFKVAVRMPSAIFKAGRYADNLSMDLLREEWYALHPDLEDRLEDPFAGRPS